MNNSVKITASLPLKMPGPASFISAYFQWRSVWFWGGYMLIKHGSIITYQFEQSTTWRTLKTKQGWIFPIYFSGAPHHHLHHVIHHMKYFLGNHFQFFYQQVRCKISEHIIWNITSLPDFGTPWFNCPERLPLLALVVPLSFWAAPLDIWRLETNMTPPSEGL